MLRGLPPRRIAAVLLLALVALLLVPAGGPSRTPQHQVTAGATYSKAVVNAARTTHAASAYNAPDRLQLDPSTPPDDRDDLPAVQPHVPVDTLLASNDGQRTRPTVRGPPAL